FRRIVLPLKLERLTVLPEASSKVMSGSASGVFFVTNAAISPSLKDDAPDAPTAGADASWAAAPEISEPLASNRPPMTYTAPKPISADSARIQRALCGRAVLFAAIW